MSDQHFNWLSYVLPATAALNVLLAGVIAWFKLGLRSFQLELLEKLNGKYMHSQLADEKFKRLEDKLDLLLSQRVPAAAAKRRARG